MIIFVVGSSRSGTTMMSRILHQHSSVFSFRELHFFEQLSSSQELTEPLNYQKAVELLDRLIGIQRAGFFKYRDKKQFVGEAEKLLDQIDVQERTPVKIFQTFICYFAHSKNKEHGCDQTPRNVLYMEEILKYIPEAKIVCMVRDPRSVLLSQKRKWKRRFLGASKIPLLESVRSYFNYHPYTISKIWAASNEQVLKWKHHKHVFTMKFEDLIDSPEIKIIELCRFFNLPFQPQMLDIPYVGSSNTSDELNRVQRGISTEAKESWKRGGLSRSEIFICNRVCFSVMKEFGYTSQYFKFPPYMSVGLHFATFPFKILIAFLFNLKRVKNIKEAVVKRLSL